MPWLYGATWPKQRGSLVLLLHRSEDLFPLDNPFRIALARHSSPTTVTSTLSDYIRRHVLVVFADPSGIEALEAVHDGLMVAGLPFRLRPEGLTPRTYP